MVTLQLPHWLHIGKKESRCLLWYRKESHAKVFSISVGGLRYATPMDFCFETPMFTFEIELESSDWSSVERILVIFEDDDGVLETRKGWFGVYVGW